jgi:putative membrane protein
MNMKRMPSVAITCCSILMMAASTAAIAQSDMASPADKKFVEEALKGGMAEVQLGQLAAQKGNSEDVKQFGQKMVDDHTKLGDQMKTVASQIGVTPPMAISAKDRALMTKLQGMSGEEFDRTYIRAMVKDHEMDNQEFKKEEADGKSSVVKNAATQGDQVIEQHLDMIKQIAKKHNVSTAPASSM